MIKVDIADQISERVPVTRSKALQAVDVILEEMKRTLLEGQRIEIRGFGVFQKKLRKKSVGRDIQREKTIDIPETYTIKFKPGIEMKMMS